jgi:hypothetical protein
VPVFVVTHRARPKLIKGETTFTFVTDGIESAVGQAKAAAREKKVGVGGASTAQQVMKAGLLNEIQIHLVPILFGGGRRLFEGGGEFELERTRVVDAPGVTHLRFRVAKGELRMPAHKPTANKSAPMKTAPSGGGKRDDHGASAEAYFSEQPADRRALLLKLRALVAKGAPDARASIKWGVPIYQQNGRNICALASFKDHVAINFFAPPSVLVDPKKKLEGGGKTSRLLKVRTAADIDGASITRWLKAAVAANS